MSGILKDYYVYQLKGGEEEAVERNNPILARREPIVIFGKDGKTKLKIGDGVNAYDKLPYTGGNEVGQITPEGGEIFNTYEGEDANKATDVGAHAEGRGTTASKDAHAEGNNTQANGMSSHAGGAYAQANADYAFAHGNTVRAVEESQVAFGRFNKFNNTPDVLFMVGNGESSTVRSNAIEVYKDGHAEIQKMGDTDNSVATKSYVDNELATFDFIKVFNTLPETGLLNKIYLVPKADAEVQDLFDEYVWTENGWEWITTKQVEMDLTDYYTKSETNNVITKSIKELDKNPILDYITYEIVEDESGNKTITITDCDESISGDYEIPKRIEGYPVTIIGEKAFDYCTSLTSITTPDSVTSIGGGAFEGCEGLTRITIPNSVTNIGDWVFYHCKSLASITIPDSVRTIGLGAFHNCEGLTSITIPNSVTSIGESAFVYCTSLSSITIPNSVTSIGDAAFSDCTSLTSITIPDSVRTIGLGAFGWCYRLTSIIIPDSVTSIGNYTFYDCTKLTNITMPDSVISIGEEAFYNCEEITDVYYEGSQEQWEQIIIGTGNEELNNATIHYNQTPTNKAYVQEYVDEALSNVNVDLSDYYTKSEVDNEIATFDFIKIVNELPITGLPNRLYLVPKADSETQDLFNEWIWTTEGWEWITTKQVEVNLDEYVKSTDYATNEKAGVVKVPGGNYGVSINADGVLQVEYATAYDLDAKVSYRKPITPKHLDYAVKVGLTTNTEILTDEEKANACEWLGAFAKPTNNSGFARIPFVNANTNIPNYMNLHDGTSAGSIAQRGAGGALQVGEPTKDTHAATKGYVDNGINALAIRKTVSGEHSLTLNDVSPLAHKCSCKLTSDTYEYENIYKFDSSDTLLHSSEDYTITHTVNDNGTITFNGHTNDYYAVIFMKVRGLTLGETYTFSYWSPDGYRHTPQIVFCKSASGEELYSISQFDNSCFTFTHTDENVDYYEIGFSISGTPEEPLVNATYYPQLELGERASNWIEYGKVGTQQYITDFTNVEVKVNGKSYNPTKDGIVTDIASVSPTMEITVTDKYTSNKYAQYVNICDFTYCVDTKKYIDNNTPEVNLEEYVKNTDYANKTNFGVVKVADGDYGIGHNTATGLYLAQANEGQILGKSNQYRPITPKNIDYAVKVGITTNTETLTEEEKASACAWLGTASKQYVDNVISNLETTIIDKLPKYDGSVESIEELPKYDGGIE